MRKILAALPLIVLSIPLLGCGDGAVPSQEAAMNAAAEAYVKLVLAVGRYDDDYIDAYFGPPEWKEEVAAGARELDAIADEANTLLGDLMALSPVADDELLELRRRSLVSQLESLRAFVDILQGASMSFDEESKALYGAVAPHYPESFFEDTLNRLDELLPGEGPLGVRLESFRDRFEIPPDRLDAVMRAAIDECRRRTLAHVALPANEGFVLEFVQDAPWSAYNWYKGDFHSLIQVNTDDYPVRMDDVFALAAHEGYPGHHLYWSLQEHVLLNGRGWVENAVSPFFSPRAVVSEGTAEYGVELAFPAEEKVEYARRELFPLAGLDPAAAELYFLVEDTARVLMWAEAETEVARRYLDGDLTAEQAIQLMVDSVLVNEEQAAQQMRFWDSYRSYIINYAVGKGPVREYIERRAGTPNERWQEFVELILSPPLPSLRLE